MPAVSVIVPIYQVEQYLPKCLDSILNQSFKDFELILVDDGTKDRSPEIMKEYAAKDCRIRMVHKENGGLSSARNAGLDIAVGKYISFIDSDDTVSSSLLADTVVRMENSGADQVLFDYRIVDQNGVQKPYLQIKDEDIDLEKYGLCNYFYHYWMPYRHGQEAWSKLYRRSIIEENHLRFQPNKEIFAEDTLFSAMYLMHTKKIAAMSGAYYNYLQRSDSLMGMKKPLLARRLMNLSVHLTEYVKKVGKEKELQNILPVLCYDKLICKGIRYDPSGKDILDAMEDLQMNTTMQYILKRLIGPMPLILYTLNTGKGIRTQFRARLFAYRWLSGKYKGAASLVQGREDHL